MSLINKRSAKCKAHIKKYKEVMMTIMIMMIMIMIMIMMIVMLMMLLVMILIALTAIQIQYLNQRIRNSKIFL